MFREMRRKNQQLPEDECCRILRTATSGVLAVAGDDGYPYAVPLSFAHDDGKLYFHVAKSGHKLDALRRNPKASFCVIDRDNIVPEKYTTYYRSVVAFGTVRIVEDDALKRQGLDLLADKYSPDETAESREAEISKFINALYVLVMDIEHMTGKEGRELAEQRKNKPTTIIFRNGQGITAIHLFLSCFMTSVSFSGTGSPIRAAFSMMEMPSLAQ